VAFARTSTYQHELRRRRDGAGSPSCLPAVRRGRSCLPSFEKTTVFVSPRWELVLLPWWKGKRSHPPWHSREEREREGKSAGEEGGRGPRKGVTL
jgi:hypothetical protein